MPYFRLSRARYHYRCARCEAEVRKGQRYFRDEPHPFAKYRGLGATARQLCLRCVLGPDDAREFLRSTSGQLPLGFELTRNDFLRCPAHVELADLTKLLASEPKRLCDLNPEVFENLICDRLDRMGYGLERVGSSTYQKMVASTSSRGPARHCSRFLWRSKSSTPDVQNAGLDLNLFGSSWVPCSCTGLMLGFW